MTQGDGTGAVNGGPGADVTIIVDGANVVGSRPDGWWRDRAGAAGRLHDNPARLAERGRPGFTGAERAANDAGNTPARAGHRAEHRTGHQGEHHAPEGDRLVPVTVLLVLEGAA